jgi:hypothetical protein
MMKLLQARTRLAALAMSLALGALAGPAAAFEWRGATPAVSITVPAVPAIALRADAAPPAGSAARLAGSDGRFSVEVLMSAPVAQAGGTSSRECAGGFLRTLVTRPGMPARDSIYRAALSEKTFLVIYLLGDAPAQQLHAHLVAAAGPQQCIEAHFSRPARPDEDTDDWRRTFSAARID